VRYTAKERAAAIADKAWWEELATAVGWDLYGWTYRTGATFLTRKQYEYAQNPGMIEVTGAQRDQILEAIRGSDLLRYHLPTCNLAAPAPPRDLLTGQPWCNCDGDKREAAGTPLCDHAVDGPCPHYS
jgi:hypothetical protein